MGVVPRVLYLHRSELCSQPDPAALVEVASRAREVHFEAGDELWRIGEPSAISYIVVRGTLGCHFEGPDGSQRTVRGGPGFAAGGLDSICDLPRFYDAVAETSVFALELTSLVQAP